MTVRPDLANHTATSLMTLNLGLLHVQITVSGHGPCNLFSPCHPHLEKRLKILHIRSSTSSSEK